MLLKMPKEMTHRFGYKKYSPLLNKKLKTQKLSVWVCIRIFWGYFLMAVITLISGLSIELISPLLLKAFIDWLQAEIVKARTGVAIVLTIAALNIIKGALTARFVESIFKLKMIAYNVIGSEIVLKVFRMDQRAAGYLGSGKIAVLVNTDVGKVVDSVYNSSNMIPDLFQVLFCGVAVYVYLGHLVWIAVAIIAIFYFVQKFIFKKFHKLDEKRRTKIDRRAGMIAEMIDGIKSIKFNASEEVLLDQMDAVRKSERSLLSDMSFRLGVSFFTSWVVAPIAGFILFSITKIFSESKISTGTLFAILMYLARLGYALNYLVDAVSSYYAALPSFERLDLAMRLKEFEGLESGRSLQEESTKGVPGVGESLNEQAQINNLHKEDDNTNKVGAVVIEGLDASWEDFEVKKTLEVLIDAESNQEQIREGNDDLAGDRAGAEPPETELVQLNVEQQDEGVEEETEKLALKQINLSVQNGEFVVLIGKVASGKTSLLRAIAGDLKLQSGRLVSKGSIALVSQEPFLVNETLKNNILFEKEFDEERYNHIVKICQLESDLENLPLGDMTEIGERGINLSGGQKQRISLARAVYSDSDIYLIDDCLSALDAHVGKAILEEVLLGYLKGKTVIMATHHTHFLSKTDRVVLLDQGKVVFGEEYEAIKNNPHFKTFQNESKKEKTKNKEQEEELNLSKRKDQNSSKHQKEENSSNNKNIQKLKEENQFNGKLTSKEKRFIGIVSPNTFLFYTKNGGVALAITILVLFLASMALLMSIDWWAGKWFNNDYALTDIQFIAIYLGLVIAFIICSALKSKLYAEFSSLSSYKIFKKLVFNLLRMKLSFFDTTPSGVVVNRAVDDMETVDFSFPKLVYICLDLFSIFALTYLIMIEISLLMLPVVVFCLLIHGYIFIRYLRASTELKRIFRVSRSPVLSTVAEMAQGMSLIRLYGFENRLKQKWEIYHDLTISAQIHETYCLCWLSLWFYGSYSIMALCLGIGIVQKKFIKRRLSG